MRIHVPETIECEVLTSWPGDRRVVTVYPGTYHVYGSQGNDYRIRVSTEEQKTIDVLVKYLDAREIL